MNVEKVSVNNINNVGANRYPLGKKAPQNQVNFRGIPADVIEKEIDRFMPRSMQLISKLGAKGGELQDIIINACGTGLIAPIFIKWNPLSKTDEDTRTYSAWRQPVSAVLAIVTQGFVTIPINEVVNNMTNSGWFGDKYNKTPFKDEEYITRLVKKNNPKMTKAEIENEVTRIKDAQKKEILRSIRDEDTVYFQEHGSTKPKKIDPDFIHSIKLETIEEKLANEIAERKRCEEIKVPHRIERSDFYRRKPQETRDFLTDIQKKIDTTTNIKEIDKFLAKKEQALKGKDNKVFLEIIQELRYRALNGNHPEIHKEMKEKVAKILNIHIPMYEGLASKEEVAQRVKDNLAERKQVMDETISCLETIKSKITKEKSTVKDIEEYVENFLKGSKSKPERLKQYKDFAKLVEEKVRTKIGNNIKGFSRISNLIVACLMLPVSCSLLNWVYPRFMDAVFPNLSNKKHSNEAKDFIDKANRNGEVKA